QFCAAATCDPVSVDDGTYTASDVAPGSDYQFILTATVTACGASTSVTSDPIDVVAAPAAPSLATPADVCGNSLVLTTSFVADSDPDVVYSASLVPASGSAITATVSGDTARASGVGPGTYAWQVIATAGSCESAPATSSTFTVSDGPTLPTL